jgi:hypothetical protein
LFGREKIESPEKSKMSAEFQKSRWKSKTSRENRKLQLEIQIVSGTLSVPPEIRNFRRKIEKSPEN